MLKNTRFHGNLNYLLNKPKKLNWKIVAGPSRAELSWLQQYDLIFDEYDLKIRKMDTPENLAKFRKKG